MLLKASLQAQGRHHIPCLPEWVRGYARRAWQDRVYFDRDAGRVQQEVGQAQCKALERDVVCIAADAFCRRRCAKRPGQVLKRHVVCSKAGIMLSNRWAACQSILLSAVKHAVQWSRGCVWNAAACPGRTGAKVETCAPGQGVSCGMLLLELLLQGQDGDLLMSLWRDTSVSKSQPAPQSRLYSARSPAADWSALGRLPGTLTNQRPNVAQASSQ